MGSSYFTLYTALAAKSVTSLGTCAQVRCGRSTDLRNRMERGYSTIQAEEWIFKNKHTDLYLHKPAHKIHFNETLQLLPTYETAN